MKREGTGLPDGEESCWQSHIWDERRCCQLQVEREGASPLGLLIGTLDNQVEAASGSQVQLPVFPFPFS